MIKVNSFLRSILISISSSYVFFAINFVGQLFLARLLSPEDFGVIALVMSIIGVIDLFIGFSIPMAYIREKETDTLFESASSLSFCVGLLPVIIALLIYFPISEYYSPLIGKYVILMTLSKPFLALSAIMIANIEKQLSFGKSYLLRGAALSSSLSISILMAYFGFNEISLIAREILSGVFLFVIVKFNFKGKLSFSYEVHEVKSLITYSLKMLFSRACELAYFKIPFLIIGSLYGTTTLGLFSQAFYLVSLVSTALNPITEKVAFIFYSRTDDNTSNFRVVNLIIFVVVFPISLALFFFPAEIITLLYGDKWLDSSTYLKYFSIFGFVLPFFNNLKSYFYSQSRNTYVAILYVFGLIIASVVLYMSSVEYAYPMSLTFMIVSCAFIYGLIRRDADLLNRKNIG